MLCETVAGFARTRFPLEKSNLKNYIDTYLNADGIDTGYDSSGGISIDTVERVYKEGKLKAVSNANPIGPKRAAQADPQVFNAFLHQLNEWIKVIHA